ncbi:hypothetical protein HPB49_011804 [Dermacentor silvarum]|uniref:Uncharacterized protein n=1 Tax=Dermacentor silvarum TaxID=543639 RepID=A0ACB8DD16_DERSI|nr:hypothetical protein HPB49_011804 [Dermacentor silvarum]
MPRLPEDDYKIVLYPKCAVDFPKCDIGLLTLLDAIQSTNKIDLEQAEQADQVRVQPIKNTITISTPDRQRADTYRTNTELRNEKYNIDMPVAAHVPAPDDSIRGVVYRVYTDETDQTIQSELPNNNGRVCNSNSKAQNLTTTTSSRYKQTTQETLRDCSESIPPLQGRSQSRGRSSSSPRGAQQSGPSTQVTWNGYKPGHQAKTTQPPNPQVRELAEQVKSLQQALANAKNKIRLLESKPNPKVPLTQNAREIGATVRRDNEHSNNMEVDSRRAAERKAESQAVAPEKNAAVPEDRLARIEAAIEKLAQEQARAAEEHTKRLREIEEKIHHRSILILKIVKQIGMPEADGVPGETFLPPQVAESPRPRSSTPPRLGEGPIRSHSASSARVEPYRRPSWQT